MTGNDVLTVILLAGDKVTYLPIFFVRGSQPVYRRLPRCTHSSFVSGVSWCTPRFCCCCLFVRGIGNDVLIVIWLVV